MRPEERRTEENMVLALVPLGKEIAEFVKARVPAGTHFGVMLLAKPTEPGGLGRVVAVTSDRHVVAFAVGQWALDVMDRPDVTLIRDPQ